MKVRSNIITRATIGAAVHSVPGVTFQDTRSRDGWYEPIREFKPRSRYEYGFEFFLSGSSPYRAQHDREEFAATWTEWGIVIAALFEIDPDAEIGWYKGRDEFYRITDEIRWRSREEKPWLYEIAA